MKIIFLDIDGVLNIYDRGKDRWGYLFNEDVIDNLQYIIEKTGAKFVISSNWKNFGTKWLKDMWKERGLPGEIITCTSSDCFITEFNDVVRGTEIKNCIIDNQIGNCNYIIIDDKLDFHPDQMDKVIKCETETGLTRELANKAIQVLNKNDMDYYCLNSDKTNGPKCKRQCKRCQSIK
jgi:hypothetical protein